MHSPGSRFSNTVGSYGSIVASPHHPGSIATASELASLELPDPAIDPQDDQRREGRDHHDDSKSNHNSNGISPKSVPPEQRPEPPSPAVPRHANQSPSDGKSSTAPKESVGSSDATPKRKSVLLKRVFPNQDWDTVHEKQAHFESTSSESEKRQDEFFAFLDDQLANIESFYQLKEEEASRRLQTLRHQLHIMRDQRIQEVLGAKKPAKKQNKEAKSNGLPVFNNRFKDTLTGRTRFGKNTEALAEMASTPGTALQPQDPDVITRRRDFTRRPEDSSNADVPYRSAKRKLKYALQEFYRGLELLKGYAYLNRTAFRKINKKYDKTVQARPTMRYMSEKVNKAWFVQSEVTENLMVATEDLYARYFERGNRKLAISQLRRTGKKSGDYSPNTFRSGLLLMAGLLFAIQALVYVGKHMRHGDATLRVRTSYLLQVSCFFCFIL